MGSFAPPVTWSGLENSKTECHDDGDDDDSGGAGDNEIWRSDEHGDADDD